MLVDLLERKRTHFVLWRPRHTDPRPALFIGVPAAGSAAPFAGFSEFELRPVAEFPELWAIDARNCRLENGGVYHYWFKLRDARAEGAGRVLYCTDPTALAVDRRFAAPAPNEPGGDASGDPAGVVLFEDGKLWACDPSGRHAPSLVTRVDALPPNNRLVIYELPTRWVRAGEDSGRSVGRGTFRDVQALVEPAAAAPGFAALFALAAGRAHLRELGVNALELLPVADSDDDLNWGYGTANFFAPDFHLGGGSDSSAPAAAADLGRLIAACHAAGMRFIVDMVTAFARNSPHRDVNYDDFFVTWRPAGHPERDPEQQDRDGFGGDLFRYRYRSSGYHPVSGAADAITPAREFMKVAVAHWIDHYRIDGLRLDSVNNTGNWDFLGELSGFARAAFRVHERCAGFEPDTVEARFLVVGEDLSVPVDLVRQGRLDGLWNESFKHRVRRAIQGRSLDGEAFEEGVHRMIDCRELGFRDAAEAVNYVTSHDVGGHGNERLFDYLVRRGVADPARRIRLAFVCLLTAVGIPMIFAGEEFADQHDLDVSDEHGSAKQVDPVNYARLDEPWRRSVFDYVARLVRFRKHSQALAVNDTDFIHADFDDGKRVLVWRRGHGDDCVVVVANFSDYGTPGPHDATAEYVVPAFPATPMSRRWREITQDRAVPEAWVGREPIYPWEAKVYALVSE